ncbi:MAG: formate dehydrogenase accessory sulfurtransferase FdhD [Theionarchaea archaeon]|nr:formate dehydrogenase accessory sulfurtransferase FdhD [Theionarchaea archaeon]
MEIIEMPAKRIDLKRGEEPVIERVVSEKKYQILINETEVALVSASPLMVKELAVGYLVGGGFLNLEDISRIDVDESAVTVCTEKPVNLIVKHIRSSDCSSHWISEMVTKEGIVQTSLSITAEVILKAVSRLQSDTETWKKTHAVHSAGLFSKSGEVIGLVEDVSRHNAFDKVVGKALLDNYDFSSVFVAVSGRITQDMVVKAGNVGISLVASRSTVIEPAVTVASALGVTVVGYVRSTHMVVFSHGERVTQ